MSPADAFKLLVGMIAPRPIGWISTISETGVSNLAPFSFFNMLGNNPPILGFSPAIGRDGKRKDTLINAEKTKCFVHNLVTQGLADLMNRTSESFPYGVSEFEKVGLTPLESKWIPAKRVKESPMNLECRVLQIVKLGDQPGNGQLVLGEVLAVHVNDESILDAQGLVDTQKLQLVSRLGRNDYMKFGEVFQLPRLH